MSEITILCEEDEVGNICEGEFTFAIEPFVPGRYWGRPENCYPDEGGVAEALGPCPVCGRKATERECKAAYAEWTRVREEWKAECYISAREW